MRGACREANLWFDASTFEAVLLTSPRWTAVSSVVLAERGSCFTVSSKGEGKRTPHRELHP